MRKKPLKLFLYVMFDNIKTKTKCFGIMEKLYNYSVKYKLRQVFVMKKKQNVEKEIYDGFVFADTLENVFNELKNLQDDEMDLIHIDIEKVEGTEKYTATYSYKDVLQMEREIISIYFAQGYSSNEIASILGVNIS